MDENMVVMNEKYITKEILQTDENGDITYKVVDRSTRNSYCLKAFNHPFDPSEIEQIHLEFQTLKQLDYPTLVRCHDLWELADGKIYVLLDYAGSEYVNAKELNVRVANESQLAHIARQLLMGLDYLHSRNIWHGNVENSNIFIDLSATQLKVLYLGKTLTRVPFLDQDLNGYDNFYWDIWNLGFIILKFYMVSGKVDVHYKFEGATVEPIDVPQSHSSVTRERSIDRNKEEKAAIVLKNHDLSSSAKTINPNPTRLVRRRKNTKWRTQDFFDLPVPVLKSSKELWRRCKNPKWRTQDFFDLPVPVLKSSKELWNFLRCCMQTDVSSRLNATRLLKHPFISNARLLKHPIIAHASSSRNAIKHPIISDASSRIERLHSSLTTSSDILSKSNLFVDIPSKSLFEDIPCESSYMNIPYTPLMNSSSPTLDILCGFESFDEFSSDDEEYTPIKRPKLSMDNHTKEISADAPDAYDKCIQHCFLFTQDFEFDMDKVIQLWIAEECINEDERMEDVAKSYFEELVHKEFMIPQKLDSVYGKMIYKINISKFLTWSQKNGTDGYLKVCECDIEILRATTFQHLSLNCATFDPKIFDALKDFKQLRTLLFHSGCRISLLPNNVFLGLKLLRSLDLSLTSIAELPSSVGNLESLRCLDVSETPIRQLPESTDRLSFLQTLRLRGCVGIRSLPKRLEKLINLRHLDIDIFRQLNSMPKGIGNLIKLQTLHAFLVGNSDRCGIEELENLNDITGSFCISGLENVSSLDKAKQAMLVNKKHLDMLELRWSDQINKNSVMEVEILECLQPHFGIKELKILCYKGSKLPSWISNPFFHNLATITLYKCLNVHILPSIGELSSLKSLTIVEMNSLKDIDSIFCRDHGNLGSGAFPSLEKLTLDNMLSLEKWSGIESCDFLCLGHLAIRYCPKLSILPVLSHFCRLLYFEISHCSQLVSLPEGGMPNSLESLIVRDCPNINEECIQNGQDRCKIAHVANIWIDFKKISLD